MSDDFDYAMVVINGEIYDLTTAAGAAKLLDEQGPEDWYWKVDLGVFNQSTTDRDILGQLFGDYVVGLQELGIPYGTPGFMRGDTEGDWVKEIERRRKSQKTDLPKGPLMKHEFTEGQMYRVTLLVKHSHTFKGQQVHEFHGADYDLTISDSDIVGVEDPPWEFRDGDVYLRAGVAYQVHQRRDTGELEMLSVFGGTSDPIDPVRNGFTEAELIYRKENE